MYYSTFFLIFGFSKWLNRLNGKTKITTLPFLPFCNIKYIVRKKRTSYFKTYYTTNFSTYKQPQNDQKQ